MKSRFWMNYISLYFLGLFVSFALTMQAPAQQVAQKMVSSNPDLKIMTHYMPWYQTPEFSGVWGWHWTMNTFDPTLIEGNGLPQLASHFHPLTGPYDSLDPDILEYQTLLMKLSGIDGVIVDWYGNSNTWDYGSINEATQVLFGAIERAGLTFAIMYEDQTIRNKINNGVINASQAIPEAQNAIQFAHDTWFSEDAYLKILDKPALFNFGPQYFFSGAQWDQLFSSLTLPPTFLTLNNPSVSTAAGAFSWPPMSSSSNGVLSEGALQGYLHNFAYQAGFWNTSVPSAFPGFKDIYAQAGLGFSYGFLDSKDGATFETTLDASFSLSSDVVQLVTWNDYGEGTNIEPTFEYGTQYLEIVQDKRRHFVDAEFPYGKEELGLPIKVYSIRKNHPADQQVNASLDQIVNNIVGGKILAATTTMDSLYVLVGTALEDDAIPTEIIIGHFYPNPVNAAAELDLNISTTSRVSVEIFDQLGRPVETLHDGLLNQGRHVLRWNVSNIASGIYFARIVTIHSVSSRPVLVYR